VEGEKNIAKSASHLIFDNQRLSLGCSGGGDQVNNDKNMAKKKKKDYHETEFYKSGKKRDRENGVAGTPEDARRKDSPYYLLRNRFNVGRKRKYNTGAEIWQVAMEYFEDVDSNPMFETKVFGTGIVHKIPKRRPYTKTGFLLYAGLDKKNYADYCDIDSKHDATEAEISLAMACRQINAVIFTQKIEGAASGEFQHQIVALELGLAQKHRHQTVEHNSKEMTADEIKKFNQELEDEY